MSNINFNAQFNSYKRIFNLSDEQAKKKLLQNNQSEEQSQGQPNNTGVDDTEGSLMALEFEAALAKSCLVVNNGSLKTDNSLKRLGIDLKVDTSQEGADFKYSIIGNRITIKNAKNCVIDINKITNPNIEIVIDSSCSNVVLNSNVKVKTITNRAEGTVINGSEYDDKIFNSGKKVIINAGEGNDIINNSGANSIVNAQGGNDTVTNSANNSMVLGGEGNDVIRNSNFKSDIYAGKGDDIITNTGFYTNIYGEEGNDIITNNSSLNYSSGLSNIYGGEGDDVIKGSAKNIGIVDGGEGNDSVAMQNTIKEIKNVETLNGQTVAGEIAIKEFMNLDESTKIDNITYDSNGKLTSFVVDDITYSVKTDTKGNITQLTGKSSSGKKTETISCSYYANGSISKKVSTKYHENGNVSSFSQVNFDSDGKTIKSKTEYTKDDKGNYISYLKSNQNTTETREFHPNSNIVKSYNKITKKGEVVTKSVSYTKDENNKLTSKTQISHILNKDSSIKQTTKYDYEYEDGKPVKIKNTVSDGNQNIKRSFEKTFDYYKNGNIKEENTNFYNANNELTQTLKVEHNKKGQITSSINNLLSENKIIEKSDFVYNKNGKIISYKEINDGVTYNISNIVYDENDEIVCFDKTNTSTNVKLTYEKISSWYDTDEPANELINGKYYEDGKLATGEYLDIYYKDGIAFTGINKDDGNKYYQDGVACNGFSREGRYYENGIAFTGRAEDGYKYKHGVCYVNNRAANGTYNDIYFKNGLAFTGNAGGRYYVNGEIFSGVKDNTLYVEGVAFNGINEEDGLFYSKGKILTGKLTLDNINDENGSILTRPAAPVIAVVNNNYKYYEKGILLTGYSSDGTLYKDGVAFTGTDEKGNTYKNGLCYVNNIRANGTYNGIYFKSGFAFTGELKDTKNKTVSTYENGILVKKEFQNTKIIQSDFVYDENNNIVSYLEENQNGEINEYSDIVYKDGNIYSYNLTDNDDVTKLYVEGELADGLVGEKYYFEGILADGLMIDGLYYSEGVMLNGTVTTANGELVYSDGVLYTGMVTTSTGELMYKDGVIANEVTVNDIMYKDGVPADNVKVDGLFYREGKIYTGFSNNNYFYNNGNEISASVNPNDNSIKEYKDGDKVLAFIQDYTETDDFGNTVMYCQIQSDNVNRTSTLKENIEYKNGKILSYTENIYDSTSGKTKLVDTVEVTNITYNQQGKIAACSRNGVFYFNDEVYSGYFNGMVYTDGVPASGEIEDILFENGVGYTGDIETILDAHTTLTTSYYGGIKYFDTIETTDEKNRPIHIEQKFYEDGVTESGISTTDIEYGNGDKIKKVEIKDADGVVTRKENIKYDAESGNIMGYTEYNSEYDEYTIIDGIQTTDYGTFYFASVDEEEPCLYLDGEAYTGDYNVIYKDGELQIFEDKSYTYINGELQEHVPPKTGGSKISMSIDPIIAEFVDDIIDEPVQTLSDDDLSIPETRAAEVRTYLKESGVIVEGNDPTTIVVGNIEYIVRKDGIDAYIKVPEKEKTEFDLAALMGGAEIGGLILLSGKSSDSSTNNTTKNDDTEDYDRCDRFGKWKSYFSYRESDNGSSSVSTKGLSYAKKSDGGFMACAATNYVIETYPNGDFTYTYDIDGKLDWTGPKYYDDNNFTTPTGRMNLDNKFYGCSRGWCIYNQSWTDVDKDGNIRSSSRPHYDEKGNLLYYEATPKPTAPKESSIESKAGASQGNSLLHWAKAVFNKVKKYPESKDTNDLIIDFNRPADLSNDVIYQATATQKNEWIDGVRENLQLSEDSELNEMLKELRDKQVEPSKLQEEMEKILNSKAYREAVVKRAMYENTNAIAFLSQFQSENGNAVINTDESISSMQDQIAAKTEMLKRLYNTVDDPEEFNRVYKLYNYGQEYDPQSINWSRWGLEKEDCQQLSNIVQINGEWTQTVNNAMNLIQSFGSIAAAANPLLQGGWQGMTDAFRYCLTTGTNDYWRYALLSGIKGTALAGLGQGVGAITNNVGRICAAHQLLGKYSKSLVPLLNTVMEVGMDRLWTIGAYVPDSSGLWDKIKKGVKTYFSTAGLENTLISFLSGRIMQAGINKINNYGTALFGLTAKNNFFGLHKNDEGKLRWLSWGLSEKQLSSLKYNELKNLRETNRSLKDMGLLGNTAAKNEELINKAITDITTNPIKQLQMCKDGNMSYKELALLYRDNNVDIDDVILRAKQQGISCDGLKEKITVFQTQLNQTGNLLYTSKIKNPDAIKTVIQDGHEYKVIDLKNDPENAARTLGLDSTDDFRTIYHATADLDTTYKLLNGQKGDAVLSTSYINTKSNVWASAKAGLIIDTQPDDIVNIFTVHTNTGYQKNYDYYTKNSYCNDVYRTYTQKTFTNSLKQSGINITKEDYGKIYAELKTKSSPADFTDIKIGDRTISADNLRSAYQTAEKAILENKTITVGQHAAGLIEKNPINEITISGGKVSAVAIKGNSLADAPADALKFAREHNLPVYILGE